MKTTYQKLWVHFTRGILLYSEIRNRFLGLKTKIIKNSSFFKAKFKKKTMMGKAGTYAVKTTLNNKVY